MGSLVHDFTCLFICLNFSSSSLSLNFSPINIFTFLPSFLLSIYSYLLLIFALSPLYYYFHFVFHFILFLFFLLCFSIHHSSNIQQMVGVPSSPQMSRNYPQGGQIQSPNQGSKKKKFLTYYSGVFL